MIDAVYPWRHVLGASLVLVPLLTAAFWPWTIVLVPIYLAALGISMYARARIQFPYLFVKDDDAHVPSSEV